MLLVRAPRALAGCGRPYGHGLNALGLDPGRLVLVEAGDDKQALWALEEALRSRAPAAVAGVLAHGIDLKTSRRLQLAAGDSGALAPALGRRRTRPTRPRPAGASRPRRPGATASAASPAPLALPLERCRNGRPGDWIVEWDHGARGFRLAETVADRALPRSAGAPSAAG